MPNSHAGRIGMKFPTITDGLYMRQCFPSIQNRATYMLWVSRRIVKEKQHLMVGSFDVWSGFFSEQLVRIAFCDWSNAIAPNSSQ